MRGPGTVDGPAVHLRVAGSPGSVRPLGSFLSLARVALIVTAVNPFLDPMDGGRVFAMPPELDIFVVGSPKPKGSKDYKGKRKNGSAILTESADVRPWMNAVAWQARQAGVRFAGPVTVHCRFVLRRPKRVIDDMTGLGKGSGDGDKLERAVWDALTEAGVIEDDSRVLDWGGSRRVAEPGEPTGARIIVRRWKN